ncbi:hypothetical protein LTR36_008176 [Oleoguttula mirabilis]|uniref:Galactose oxidase n=1 Tax=Oleoguttula mirabilis TaxID=1507867 RepID=A0AAV9J889_9PEZI|nr:hypothetical protein LTR36_008176 [Oleoguttula mirabilis]
MRQSPSQLASLLALLGSVAAQELPYNPTRVLVLANTTYAYIFGPSTQSGTPGQSELRFLDFSYGPISNAQSPFQSVSDSLPFLDDNELLPFTPTVGSGGNITAITGNCSQGANGTQVWRYATDAGRLVDSAWTQLETTDQELASESTWTGASYLASGIAFSQHADADDADTDIFVFGGMCPFGNSTAATWTSAANYSNQMLALSPDAQAGSSDVDISLGTSRGPPIAEAGFSITPLTPTYTLNSSGEAQTQQQDFVLLGGHTQSAFINMSQVALFSLPQESWTFLPVAQPSSAKTDLATRQTQPEVEPRSGHTAVLSEDGTTVVLFGGWVGDISTPAQPQLAVLEFGSGYGGIGDWSWTIPTQSGSGLPSGAGIYGHGAAMLPGGVMMVVGGYSIPAPSSRIKRATQTVSTELLLYNTTSKTWIDSYSPPVNLTDNHGQGSGPLSKKSQQIGLGVGLAIGAAILILLVVYYFWYNRRLKRAQEARGRTLLSRSSDGSFGGAQADQPFLSDGGIDGRGGDTAGVGRFWNVWDHSTGAYPARAPQMQQQADAAGSTGLFVNVPSPTRGLRKAPAGRNYQYHQAPRYDDQRISRGSASIHPIAEREDEDDSLVGRDTDSLTDAERRLREVERVLTGQDPFQDAEPNPLGSHPVSPELGEPTVRRVPTGAGRMSPAPARPTSMNRADSRNWTIERERADPVLRIDTGRVSPSKSDERTSSTLSEMSQHSGNSITRSMSTRTAAVLAAALAGRAASNNSPENCSSSDGRTRTMSTNGGRKSPFYYQTRARSSTTGSAKDKAPDSASTDADSFMTAKTNFVDLQSQGETLLGGRPTVDRDDPYQRALAAHSSTRENIPSPTYGDGPLPPLQRRRQGWMGSLRRALNAVSISDRSFSMTSSSGRYADEQRSSTPSPVKDRQRPNGAPRRTVSDGGTLLRQKRGQRDWEDTQFPRYRDDPDPGDWGEAARSPTEKHEAEEDWDVEGAASKRDVQMMFTVPKARLRVVNADMDRMSMRSASDGALSRTGSLNKLRHEESMKTLRARSEAEKLFLPPTAEEEREEAAVRAPVEEHAEWDEKEKAA